MSQPSYARSTLDVGLSLAAFSYAEKVEPPLRSTHRGLLPSLRAGFDHRFRDSSWTLGLGTEYGISSAGYDGSTQEGDPATADSKHSFFNFEILADAALQSGRAPLHLYFGVGTHYWMRHISPGGPGDLRERYLWFYVPVGIRYTYWEGEHFFARVDLSVRLNVGGNIVVYLSDTDPDYRNASLSLGLAVGARVQFPFRYFVGRQIAVQVSPFFEFRPIGQGGTGNLETVGGQVAGTAYEPASHTFIYGAFVGPAFLF